MFSCVSAQYSCPMLVSVVNISVWHQYPVHVSVSSVSVHCQCPASVSSVCVLCQCPTSVSSIGVQCCVSCGYYQCAMSVSSVRCQCPVSVSNITVQCQCLIPVSIVSVHHQSPVSVSSLCSLVTHLRAITWSSMREMSGEMTTVTRPVNTEGYW